MALHPMMGDEPWTPRDEFAKAAMTGLIASIGNSAPAPTPEKVAEIAYKTADAMLKIRLMKRP